MTPKTLSSEKGNAVDTTKTKLVLGHAGKSHPDAITVDIDPEHKPDVIHNLNEIPWPFKDNQFQEITAHHVFEHLNDLMPVMDEIYRICHPDGRIHIEVPHHSGWCAHSPEHKMFFNYFAFDGYIQHGKTAWLNKKKFKLISREITFHRSFRRYFLHKLFNRFPMNYERFWTYIFPAEHFKATLQPIKG